MKKLLIGLLALGTISAFAQTEQIRAGEIRNLQCPAGTTIQTSQVNSRTVTVSCSRSCQIFITTQCDFWVNYERSSSTCNGYTDYFVLARLPNGNVKKVFSNAVSKEVANANLDHAVKTVVDYGWCENANY